MRKQRKSKLFEGIVEGIKSKGLKEPFSVDDVNIYCNDLLKKSPAFLGKHSVGNPGKYSEFFVRISKGKYCLNKSFNYG